MKLFKKLRDRGARRNALKAARKNFETGAEVREAALAIQRLDLSFAKAKSTGDSQTIADAREALKRAIADFNTGLQEIETSEFGSFTRCFVASVRAIEKEIVHE